MIPEESEQPMHEHDPISILYLDPLSANELAPFWDYLATMPHVHFKHSETLPDSLSGIHVVITTGMDPVNSIEPALRSFIQAGGVWLHMVEGSVDPLPEVFGVQPGSVGPTTEVRILFTDPNNPMAERLTDAFYVSGRFQELQVKAPDTETVVYADWHYTHRAVIVQRPVGRGYAACTTLQAFEDPDVQQIFYRLMRSLSHRSFGHTIGVGILGYAPSVGRLHGLGCQNTY